MIISELTLLRPVASPSGFTAEATAELETRGPSLSQSHVDAPFILEQRTAVGAGRKVIEKLAASTVYPEVFLSGKVQETAHWLDVLNEGRTLFGCEVSNCLCTFSCITLIRWL
jgi:hypothetical protein